MSYLGFKKLKNLIAKKGKASNPDAVSAAIARKKYGNKAVQKHAVAGTSMKTEKHKR